MNPASLLGFFKRTCKHVIRIERAIGDRLVDSGELLPNNPPGADIQMADFRIAKLAFREANISAACRKPGIWPGLKQVVEIGDICPVDGTDTWIFCYAEAINNDQECPVVRMSQIRRGCLRAW